MGETAKKIIKIGFGVAGIALAILLLAMLVSGNRFGKVVPMEGRSLRVFDGGVGMMEAGLPADYPLSETNLGASESTGRVLDQKMMIADDAAALEIASEDKKVIKNANLDLRVERVDDANQKIFQIAKDNGGEVFASNVFINPASKIKSGNATVKVPVGNFQKTFEELKKASSLVVSESTSGQDVTEEYSDLQARLRNKQAEEASIAKILDRSGSIEDVLKVTRELNRVRGEIERLEAQIKLLNSQTDKATIFVSMTEDPDVTVVDSWRPWQLVKDSVNQLIRGFQRSVDFAIVLLISILPILVLYFVLAYLLYWVGRRIYLRWKEKREQVRQ